jgi:TP901 family phage tail tape measure protein
VPVRKAEVIYIGDAASLLRANEQAKVSNKGVAASAIAAGKAAQESAAMFGASAEKQAAAAGEAARKQAAAMGATEAAQVGAYQHAASAAEVSALRQHKAADTVVHAGELAAGGITIAAAAAIDLGIKAEKSAAQIAASSGIGIKAAQAIEDRFLSTAGSAEFSGQKIGAAYSTIAGELKTVEGHALSSSQAVKVMDASMDLTVATGDELRSTTESLGNVMLTYRLHTSQAAEASDILFNASGATGSSVEEVASAVDKARGRLGALSPSLKDSAGLMEDLAKNGIQGRQSLTALNGVFSTLLGGGKGVTVMSKELGLQIYDSRGKFVGLHSIITQLEPKMKGLTEASQLEATKALFGASANKQLLEIILQGPHAFDASTKAVSKHGEAHKAAKKNAETLHGELEKLKAAVEDLGGKFGEDLTPEVKVAAVALEDGAHWLGKHETAAKALAGVIGTVLGGALTVFAYTKAAQFIDATKGMIAGMGTLAAKVGLRSAEVDASFAGQATAAEAAAAKTAAAQDALVADIATADTAIETANAAAGASFLALLGPIAVAVAAAAAASEVLNRVLPEGSRPENLLGGNQPGESGREGEVFLNQSRKKQTLGTGGGIMGLLMAHGLTAAQAAGVVGNLQQESSLNPNAPGGGLDQGQGSRAHGGTVAQQIEAIWKELEGSEHATLVALKAAKSPAEAARIFSEKFERPGKPMLGNRERYADEAYKAHPQAHHSHRPHEQATSGTGTVESPEEYTKKHKKHKAETGPSPAAIDHWAESAVGKFAESWGKNTGPELDKLQSEFHTHAAAWCAEFATTAAMMGGANKAVRTASVATIREWAEQGSHGYKKGVSHDPSVGSLMMFGDSHVAFVQSVDKKAGTVEAIEGNANGSGGVVRRTRHISEGDYATPLYHKLTTGKVALERAGKAYAEAAKKAEHLLLTAGQKAGVNSLTAGAGSFHGMVESNKNQAADNASIMGLFQARWAATPLNLTTAAGATGQQQRDELVIRNDKARKKFYERELKALQKEATYWAKLRDSYRRFARHTHGKAKKEALDKAASYQAKIDQAKSEAQELKGTIFTTETEIIEAQTTLGGLPVEVATANANAAAAATQKTEEGFSNDYNAYQNANSRVDLEERAGILTPAQAKAAKIANANKALAGGFGALSETDILQVKGDLKEFSQATQEATNALQAHTEALKEATKTLAEFTNAGNDLARVEAGSFAKSLADMVNGQIAGVNYQGRQLTPGSGAAARY